MKLAILSVTISAVCAFAPSAHVNSASSLQMSSEEVVEEVEPVVPAIAPINGWVPDASLPLYGLPGSSEPMGMFDPFGFTRNLELTGAKRFREAEVVHGRVAMMATLGYFVQEATPTITYGMSVPTIANNQIPEVSWGVLFPFFLAINLSEAYRAVTGWVEPGAGTLFTLRENYYPGQYCDPLNIKPKDPVEFAIMQTKELNNGRLAMIGAAGMCVQEQITGQPIFPHIMGA